jgi:transcriptional regulator with XRE-family HTH domain
MTAAAAEPKRMPRNPTPTKAEDDSPGARLRRLVNRKARGRTDAQIAELAGMSDRAFSRLMTGGVPDPRVSTIEAICQAVGATLCDYERA